MKHPIDQIFQQHLALHKVEPSADVWEKINDSIRQKKDQKIKLWYSIAASLLIVGISSFIFLSQQPSEPLAFQINVAVSENKPTDLPEKPSPEKHVTLTIENHENNTSKDDALAEQKPINPKQKKPEEQLPHIPQKLENLQANISSKLNINNDMKMIAAVDIDPSENIKNSTFFDKITNKALEIKNSDGVMAEIRQFKDEVISLEFFKTKKSI